MFRKKLSYIWIILVITVILTGCGENNAQSEDSVEQYVMSNDEYKEYAVLSEKYDELLVQYILLEELKEQYDTLCEKDHLTEEEQHLLEGYEERIDKITKDLEAEPSLYELQNQLDAIANGVWNSNK